MIKSDIQSLFPTPVYMANINRKLTNRELSFVEEQKKHCQSNKGNINTIDNYILNKPELKKIKKPRIGAFHWLRPRVLQSPKGLQQLERKKLEDHKENNLYPTHPKQK